MATSPLGSPRITPITTIVSHPGPQPVQDAVSPPSSPIAGGSKSAQTIVSSGNETSQFQLEQAGEPIQAANQAVKRWASELTNSKDEWTRPHPDLLRAAVEELNKGIHPKKLNLAGCKLTRLPIKELAEHRKATIEKFDASNNELTGEVDFTPFAGSPLRTLWLSENRASKVLVEDVTNLIELSEFENTDTLTEIALRNNTELKTLYASGNPHLAVVKFEEAPAIERIQCMGSGFTKMDLRHQADLKFLNADHSRQLKKIIFNVNVEDEGRLPNLLSGIHTLPELDPHKILIAGREGPGRNRGDLEHTERLIPDHPSPKETVEFILKSGFFPSNQDRLFVLDKLGLAKGSKTREAFKEAIRELDPELHTFRTTHTTPIKSFSLFKKIFDPTSDSTGTGKPGNENVSTWAPAWAQTVPDLSVTQTQNIDEYNRFIAKIDTLLHPGLGEWLNDAPTAAEKNRRLEAHSKIKPFLLEQKRLIGLYKTEAIKCHRWAWT